jgi:hypothetical protein
VSKTLQIRQFDWNLYPALTELANAIQLPFMLNRQFLGHYYLGQDWSKLFLAMDGPKCLGTMGIDILQFTADASLLRVAFASNFYSLQSGIGGMLWLKWIKLGDMGLVFGGSEDTHRIISAFKFDYYPGVNIYRLNAQFEAYKEDSALKGIVKARLRPWKRKKLPDYASKDFVKRFADIQVVERQEFSAEMMAPISPFTLRFQPSLEYLQWRYNPHLTYVHYRLFEIVHSGQSYGYCVLNDGPNELMVAYADGKDPAVLAVGILKAIFLVGEKNGKHRKAVLSSSHPVMQTIFMESGFQLTKENYSFAMGSLRDSQNLGDPKTWLINFGMGDNDLRQNMFWTT